MRLDIFISALWIRRVDVGYDGRQCAVIDGVNAFSFANTIDFQFDISDCKRNVINAGEVLCVLPDSLVLKPWR